MKKTISTAVLTLLTLVAWAQTDSTRYNGITTCRDNWYIELSVGGNVLFSKDARLNVAEKNITPNITFAAGKWFSPFFGARLQLHGYSLAAGSTSQGMYIADRLPDGTFGNDDPVRNHVSIRPDGSYVYPIYYINAHADLTISILNLINRGMAPTDHWDVIPAIGVGYMHTFAAKGVPAADVMTANFSIMGKYRILPQLDVNLEVQSTLMPDIFDGRLTGSVLDHMFSFSVGVTYNIFGHNFKGENRIPARRPKTNHRRNIDEIYEQNERNAQSNNLMLDKIEEMNRRLDHVENGPSMPNITVINDGSSAKELDGKIIAAILYRIGTVEPTSSPAPQLKNVQAMLEAFPEAKITVEGYADNATGSDQYNMEISRQRVSHAIKLLTDQYGIPSERIKPLPCGSTSHPYSHDPEVQRAVLFRITF